MSLGPTGPVTGRGLAGGALRGALGASHRAAPSLGSGARSPRLRRGSVAARPCARPRRASPDHPPSRQRKFARRVTRSRGPHAGPQASGGWGEYRQCDNEPPAAEDRRGVAQRQDPLPII